MLSHDPRHLFVRLAARGIALDLLSVHAPHKLHPGQRCCPACSEYLDRFWSDLETRVNGLRREASDFIVGIDANGRLGSITTEAVSNHSQDEEDCTGARVHRFALHQQLAFPSTFAACHKDKWDKTFRSSAGTLHRIDFLLVPMQWMQRRPVFSIDQHLDIVLTERDHYPTRVDLTATPAQGVRLHRRRRPVCHVPSMRDPEKVEKFKGSLAMIQPVPWRTHGHDHHCILFKAIRQAAVDAFPFRQTQKKKAFLSQASWELITKRKDTRKNLEFARHQAARLFIQTFYHAWRAVYEEPFGLKPPSMVAFGKIRDAVIGLDRRQANLARSLNTQRKVFRESTVKDREQHFTALADKAQAAAHEGNHKMLYRTAREIAPRNPKPPNALKLEDGSIAPDQLAARKRWQRFFSEKLGGTVSDFSSLLDAATQRQAATRRDQQALQLNLDIVPTRRIIAMIIKKSKRGHAHGEDAVPADLLAVAPELLSRLLLPVWLQFLLRLDHPLAWK